jgi:alkylated DNA repair dioxygenase AlkB
VHQHDVSVAARRHGLTSRRTRANIEHVFLQGSLFGCLAPEFDAAFGAVERIELDDTSWVDLAPGWLRGADEVFDRLYESLHWRQRRNVRMYDSLVDEPRLVAWWSEAHGPEPLPILGEVRAALSARYGEHFESIGFNLYRDGDDSVAWHGDRHRHTVVNPIVAILSVGAARPLRLRPRGGGSSRAWELGHGDLFVMGGACQHDWEHCVPKMRHVAGPRMSITYRYGMARSRSYDG